MKTEYRIKYVNQDDPKNVVYIYSDNCDESGLDYAAGDPLLLAIAIVWIEARVVMESDWMIIGPDEDLTENIESVPYVDL